MEQVHLSGSIVRIGSFAQSTRALFLNHPQYNKSSGTPGYRVWRKPATYVRLPAISMETVIARVSRFRMMAMEKAKKNQ